MTRRPRLATLWLGGCSGCHMSLLDLDERLIEVLGRADLVYSPLVDAKTYPEDVDVALVEGAVATTDQLALLREVRARTRTVVALGDCAVTGNVPALRNALGPAAATLALAWRAEDGAVPEPDPALPRLLDRVEPLHAVVRIDLFVPGCPPPADLIHAVVSDLLDGRRPDLAGRYRFG